MPEDFDYVVERKPPHPICFGSKLARNTAPIGKSLSPFQKMAAPENNPLTGPGHYKTEKYNCALNRLVNKIRSNKGVGPLASDDPRFKDKIFMRTPSPTRYNPGGAVGAKRQGGAPFGSKTRRLTTIEHKLPGPGTYDIASKKCRRTRFMYNFGRPSMISSIEIICVDRPSDACVKCEQICAGDYWHKDYTVFLCHLCWEEEKRGRELYNEKELNTFQEINCKSVVKLSSLREFAKEDRKTTKSSTTKSATVHLPTTTKARLLRYVYFHHKKSTKNYAWKII